MSLFVNNMIDMLLGNMTGYKVSQETGIPSSTVRRYAAGVGDIPDIYTVGVRSAYQRINYQDMREAGFSSWQARRFRTYNPAHSQEVMSTFDDTVQELARGYATKRVESLGLDPTEDNLKRFQSAGSRKVREGLRNSKLPLEDWVDYAKK